MPSLIKLLQWNIQDGGGGKQRKKISLPLLYKLIADYKPDVVVLNESAAKSQGCPKATGRYSIPGYVLHTPECVRNHFISVLTSALLPARVARYEDTIRVDLEHLLIAALHHDCHKGVDKPARDIQASLTLAKNKWVAIGDWNYALDKIARGSSVNDPALSPFSVVNVTGGAGVFAFSAVAGALNRGTHKSGWIDGALTLGVSEIQRIHFSIVGLRTPQGKIASDHLPTLITLA